MNLNKDINKQEHKDLGIVVIIEINSVIAQILKRFKKSADRPLKLKYLDNYSMNLNKRINKQEYEDLGIVVIIKIHSVITQIFKLYWTVS